MHCGYRLLPWCCLALLFWIPGVDLEYPADPFEHYARINDWARHGQVTSHIVWFRSSFFLAYSLFGWLPMPSIQLKLFDLYYTACCLLLCVQYHRLALATGLRTQAALAFALLQALLLGNGAFGFYRYYGMSSTLFAQLGAVVATRLTLESLPIFCPRCIMRTMLSVIPPFALIATNHEQGLGLATLGMSAVVVYRLGQWRRTALLALGLILLVLSIAAVLWYPRHPAIQEIYQRQGWMTDWFSFNLFSLSSPAFARTNMILGATGWLGLIAAFWLARKNHPVGWLTLIPVLVLVLPVFTIPFAQALALRRAVPDEQIVLFHRMLLAIPSGLALVVLGSQFLAWRDSRRSLPGSTRSAFRELGLPTLLVGIAALLALPAQAPYFNRLWSALVVAPADLTMHESLVTESAVVASSPHNPSARVLSGAGLSFVFHAAGVNRLSYPKRLIRLPPTSAPSEILPWVFEYTRVSLDEGADVRLIIPQSRHLFSPGSQAALLSGHWLPYEAAIENAGEAELQAQASRYVRQKRMNAVAPYFYRSIR